MKFDFSESKPMTQAERWRIAVRQLDAMRTNLPLESSVSYPVPGSGTIHFFIYRALRKQEIYQLYGRVTLALPSLEPTEIVLSESGDPFPGLPDSVGLVPSATPLAQPDALYDLYDLIMKRFPNQRSGVLGEQWLEALHTVSPSELMPFYEALNPEFFAWSREG